MVIVAFVVGELAALVGVSEKAALIIYAIILVLTVTVCYGLVFVGKTINMWYRVILILCSLCLLYGYHAYKSQSDMFQYYDDMQYGENPTVNVRGKVVGIAKKQYYYVVELEANDGTVQLQMENIEGIKYGAVLSVEGSIYPMKTADNPGNYDEKGYLHSNGIILKVKVAEGDYVIEGGTNDYSYLNDSLYRIKQKAIKILEKQCTEKEMGLIAAIVLGDKAYMDEDVKELYSSQSVAHILSISGLHISVIGMGLYSLMRKRMRYLSSATVSAVIMILFSFMTGNSVSAVRAVIMFVMHVVADVVGRKYDLLSAISLSALILLIDNPFYITNASFLLSYSAMLAVSVTAPIVTEYLSSKNVIIKTLAFNASLTFTSMPINACLFYRLSTYSIFLNLIVVPLMGMMLTMAIVGIGVSVFFESLGAACLGTSVYILRFYEWVCKVAEGLPASSVVTGAVPTEQAIIYYLALVGVLFLMWRRNVRRYWAEKKDKLEKDIEKQRKEEYSTEKERLKKYKTVEHKKEKNVMKVNIEGVTAGKMIKAYEKYICRGIKAVLVVLMIYIVYHPKNNDFELYFLDVGQGDCAYIHSATGNDYLIDCGSTDESEVGKYKLESFLEYMDVDNIECVFVSHCDADHVSGVQELIERGNVGIGTIVLPATERLDLSENASILVKLALENGIDIKYFSSGSSYKDGELEFVCLSPDIDGVYEDINEASNVLLMKYADIQTLYAGDIGADTEEMILELLEEVMYKESMYEGGMCENSIYEEVSGAEDTVFTIYKVAHHGSKYSSSSKLLEVLQPDIAIISCGEDNSYGHPHEETLERLKEAGASIMTTPEYGAIMIEIDEGIEIQSWKGSTQ